MKRLWFTVGMVMNVAMLLVACTPKPEPTPYPVSTAPALLPTNPVTTSPKASSEDIAWAKVIETAKKEGRPNIYGVSMTGDVGLAVSRSFEAKYGVKLDIITGGGAALAERIKTEKRMGMMTADVMVANPLQISNIKAAGATVSSEEITVLKEQGVWRTEPWASDPERHILLYSSLFLTSFANTNVLKPQDFPRSFAELAQPRWKGKIVTWDAGISSGPTNLFLTLMRRKLIDEDTLRAIGRNGIDFTPNTSEASKLLLQGAYNLDIATGNITYGSISASTGAPLPIKALAMQEGTVFTNNALAAVKDGPHPNVAKVFVNWMLSPEGQNVFIGAQQLTPVRKDVPDFVPLFLQIEPIRVVTTTIEDDKENTRLLQDKWLAKLWKN